MVCVLKRDSHQGCFESISLQKLMVSGKPVDRSDVSSPAILQRSVGSSRERLRIRSGTILSVGIRDHRVNDGWRVLARADGSLELSLGWIDRVAKSWLPRLARVASPKRTW